jgi:hypothetical protein
MKNTLPAMGRPSKSGRSIKLLGACEYFRRLNEQKKGVRKNSRHWTGLSPKQLGEVEYRRRYRQIA